VSILSKEIIILKLKESRMVFDITMRVSKNGESKSETVGVAVTSTEKVALEKLAGETERSVSYWVGKFMRDGWAAYNRATGGGGNGGTDAGGSGSLGRVPPIDRLSSKSVGRKKGGKKREAS
jgi:hypothetical protein